MLDYIYMKNLPIYIYIIYFSFGVSVSIISFNIANEKFSIKKIPFWIGVCMSIFCNLLVFVLVIFNIHVGFYLVISMVMPYVSIWRSNNLI